MCDIWLSITLSLSHFERIKSAGNRSFDKTVVAIGANISKWRHKLY